MDRHFGFSGLGVDVGRSGGRGGVARQDDDLGVKFVGTPAVRGAIVGNADADSAFQDFLENVINAQENADLEEVLGRRPLETTDDLRELRQVRPGLPWRSDRPGGIRRGPGGSDAMGVFTALNQV